jgi:hypothetical protein
MSVHAISPGPKPEALGAASALTLPASAESYLPNGWQRAPQANSKALKGPAPVYPAGKPGLSGTASGGYVMLC